MQNGCPLLSLHTGKSLAGTIFGSSVAVGVIPVVTADVVSVAEALADVGAAIATVVVVPLMTV